MVGFDRVRHFLALPVAAGELRADHRVAALHFVGERLADVVEERAPFRERHVRAQFSGHHPRQVGAFHKVGEHVLPIRGAVPQLSEQRHQLRVHVGDPHFKEGVFSGLLLHSRRRAS